MFDSSDQKDQGYEHKFLVVVDDTEECGRAVTFAACRMRRLRGTVVLLYVIEPDHYQHWLGVEDIMRAEATDHAEKLLDKYQSMIADKGDIRTEAVIREGRTAEEIVKLIEEDREISILVLAASTSSEGPGPLVSAIASRGMGNYPIPVAIVPGGMTDAQIEAIS
ncbi:MAG TPA: universal stress protein [Devosiaceae bacterium]